MSLTRSQKKLSRGLIWCALFLMIAAFSACNEFEKPRTEPFYSQTAPPQKREFRWANGKMPKTFDPAMASAPPETDIVRAIYDGLTDNDPRSLTPLPAIAVKWESADDQRTWTFHLRKDARWTNGERITARDFVRSWERLSKLGKKVPQRQLFENIVGMAIAADDPAPKELENESVIAGGDPIPSNFAKNQSTPRVEATPEPSPAQPSPSPTPKIELGVVAVDPHTLKVSLVRPDADFPALVAHPIFRPVYGDGKELEAEKLFAGIVTSGAFRIASVGTDGVTLDRSENHWDRASVELERVRFVPIDSAEKALEAYRLGEVDAVTNAHFEPLALKLLKPFEDFRQTTHAALNFYEINQKKAPFDDRRVREALALAIDRDRLTDGEMEGSTRPATSFLPFGSGAKHSIAEDPEKARRLFEEAGFANGENFPTVRLVINRNDVQQRVARLVAKMWEDNLKVKTAIVVVESSEIEKIRISGEFDLIRRGVVLPAADEESAMLAILAPPKVPPVAPDPLATPAPEASPTPAVSDAPADPAAASPTPEIAEPILDHAGAIAEVPAIPLYFPTSYSLVKPYVVGFDLNVLDAPSLKSVRVDTGWQPPKAKNPS